MYYEDIINDCIKEPKMIDLYINIAKGGISCAKNNKRNKIIIKQDNYFILLCIILKLSFFLNM
jgi:hypothetical protein